MNKKVEELFNSYIEYQRTLLDLYIQECESPIEEIFATAFFIEKETNIGYLSDVIADAMGLSDAFLRFRKQAVVEKYRVDFILSIFNRETKVETAKYIVECDGHEFHEKTKEQVAKRNERDRFLESIGYTVLHLSGSEIYNDPEKALHDVLNTIFMKEAIKRGKTIEPPYSKEGE